MSGCKEKAKTKMMLKGWVLWGSGRWCGLAGGAGPGLTAGSAMATFLGRLDQGQGAFGGRKGWLSRGAVTYSPAVDRVLFRGGFSPYSVAVDFVVPGQAAGGDTSLTNNPFAGLVGGRVTVFNGTGSVDSDLASGVLDVPGAGGLGTSKFKAVPLFPSPLFPSQHS